MQIQKISGSEFKKIKERGLQNSKNLSQRSVSENENEFLTSKSSQAIKNNFAQGISFKGYTIERQYQQEQAG